MNNDLDLGEREHNSTTVLIAEREAPRSTKQTTRAENRRKKLRSLRKAGLTWVSLLTLIVVVAYTTITEHQWESTQESVHQLQRQIAVENRAWLVVDTDYIDSFRAQQSEVDIPIRFTNIGTSPAQNVNGWVEVDEVQKAQIASFDFSPGATRNRIRAGIIYPKFPHTTEVSEWEGKNKAVVIDAKKHQQFANGDIVFFVQGHISYIDVFQVPHWFEFCHAISAVRSSRAEQCVAKNKIDPNDQ